MGVALTIMDLGSVQEQKRKSLASRLSSFFSSLKKRLASTSLTTYFLFCVFGVGSWIAINGVWAELPILVITQPECFKLAATLTLIIQIANIGPLVYSVVKVIWHRLHLRDFNLEVAAVFVIVGVGIVSSLLLGIFWNQTAVIGGKSSSFALYILAFSLALVDCTSSVVFVPFMKHYPSQYLTGLYIGEGLSGMLPSITALIQGSVNDSLRCVPGNETYTDISHLGIRFSPNVYFSLLAVVMVMCCLAFTGLLVIPVSRKARLVKEEVQVTFSNQQQTVEVPCLSSETHDQFVEQDHSSPLLEEDDSKESAQDGGEEVNGIDTQIDEIKIVKNSPKYRRKLFSKKLLMVLWEQRTLLICLTILSFVLNGSLPAVSSFAFGKYSNLVFHLAVNLGLLASPLAAFLYMVVPTHSKLIIAIFTSLCCILGTYILINAFSYGSLITGNIGGVVIVSSHNHHMHTYHINEYIKLILQKTKKL